MLPYKYNFTHAETRNKYAAEKIRFERTISCTSVHSCVDLCMNICVCSNEGQSVSTFGSGRLNFMCENWTDIKIDY